MKTQLYKIWLSLIACVFTGSLMAQPLYQNTSLLFQDAFTKMHSEQWIIETQKAMPAKVFVEAGYLIIDAEKDATVWLNKKLIGNLLIDFYRKVIMENGLHDRLSDLNFFWMAGDPKNSNLFTRKGLFREYDSLLLYYAGIGGNDNTTTRFRKYKGNGEKSILSEYTDAAHLLQPNTEYHFQIIVKDGLTQCWVDDQLYFSYQDPDPIHEGYFGFRTTKSRQSVSKLKIYQIK
jgi:rhamnogalacturonan endolyase